MRLTRPCATNASGKRKLSGGATLKQHAAQLAQLPQTCSAPIAAGGQSLPEVGPKPPSAAKPPAWQQSPPSQEEVEDRLEGYATLAQVPVVMH